MTERRQPQVSRVLPKRRDHPAYRDGVCLALLLMAEQALIRLLGGRHEPEHEHISAAFGHVVKAEEIVQARLERRR